MPSPPSADHQEGGPGYPGRRIVSRAMTETLIAFLEIARPALVRRKERAVPAAQ